MTDQFDQITQNFDTKPARKTMNAATAAGVLLILLAVLAIIPWGFGADRFLWIAAGSGGAGVVLVAVGAIISRKR